VSNLGVDVIQPPRVAHRDGPAAGPGLLTCFWLLFYLA